MVFANSTATIIKLLGNENVSWGFAFLDFRDNDLQQFSIHQSFQSSRTRPFKRRSASFQIISTCPQEGIPSPLNPPNLGRKTCQNSSTSLLMECTQVLKDIILTPHPERHPCHWRTTQPLHARPIPAIAAVLICLIPYQTFWINRILSRPENWDREIPGERKASCVSLYSETIGQAK
jgi:hypothetical protein